MIKITSFGSGSSGNSYLIDDGKTQLMIECGVQFKEVQKKMKFGFSRVAGCLISHEHRDHCKYVRQLLEKTAIDVYSTRGTFEGMAGDDVLKINCNDYYRFNILEYKKSKMIGTWQITPFKTEHDAQEPCGFLIDNEDGDRLVFITDSYYVRYKFPNVTHIMVEANHSRDIMDQYMVSGFQRKLKTRIMESHFDYEDAMDFIKANKSQKLQEVWLLHLSSSNSNVELFRQSAQEVAGVPVYIA